ncbi:MAG: hypothetical protein KME13_11385 [Myxacorys californica WJT36-NPBG1]|jgi:hypothetical protein|nr:hypothetical protein [Myxacorys californica WJT36-NPBG1]
MTKRQSDKHDPSRDWLQVLEDVAIRHQKKLEAQAGKERTSNDEGDHQGSK